MFRLLHSLLNKLIVPLEFFERENIDIVDISETLKGAFVLMGE